MIHGNRVKDLPDSYKRYLMNYFRKSLEVMGTPIRIQFKEGENPYANKRNTLTPTQMRKRKRLIKHIKKQIIHYALSRRGGRHQQEYEEKVWNSFVPFVSIRSIVMAITHIVKPVRQTLA